LEKREFGTGNEGVDSSIPSNKPPEAIGGPVLMSEIEDADKNWVLPCLNYKAFTHF